jgi:hypothetical protein
MFKRSILMHKVRDSLIIIVVQVGGVSIRCTCSLAAAVEALTKKERQDETPFTTKIDGKTSLGPSLQFQVRHKFNYFLIC